jgi:chromosome partitioning protein
MKCITVLAEKGGVGKTTISTHIAAGLCLSGYNVMLLDADPQGHAGTALGFEKRPALYDLLVRDTTSWKDVVQTVDPQIYTPAEFTGQLGFFGVVVGNEETMTISMHIKNTKLRRRLAQIQMDYVIVDTNPSPSMLQEAIAVASDYVIIPTQLEPLSVRNSVSDTMGHIDPIREAAADNGLDIAKILGIIPNQKQGNVSIHTAFEEYLYNTYGELVWPAIPRASVIPESQLKGQLLYASAPRHKVTVAFWSIVQRIIQRIEVEAY